MLSTREFFEFQRYEITQTSRSTKIVLQMCSTVHMVLMISRFEVVNSPKAGPMMPEETCDLMAAGSGLGMRLACTSQAEPRASEQEEGADRGSEMPQAHTYTHAHTQSKNNEKKNIVLAVFLHLACCKAASFP
eukprot:1462275-Amphidinium_carterae.1